MSASESEEAGDANPTMVSEPTHVVTCFLLRRDRGTDEVLLAQRSARVRTYRGAWGAISGYIEEAMTPLAQAYEEIDEETGLRPAEVTLLREGEPLAFRDAAISQDWVVHPFLFLALDPNAVRLDWEAQRFAWTPPEQVATRETVPRLAEALALVYPPE